MTSDEIFDYYDEHWNDYNKVMDMLQRVVHNYEDQIIDLERRLTESYLNTNNSSQDDSKAVKEMKSLLQECQDKLDEETHKLDSIKYK